MSERAVADSAAVWGKRDDMIVRVQSPFNAEPAAAVLANSEITPVDGFYARNHGPFPDIAAQQWRLTVGGLVDRPLMLTYDQLTTDFEQHSVVATLACAGNRRAELLRVRPIPGKDPWEHGAISTAEWSGVRLADVLVATAGSMWSSSRPTWPSRLVQCSPTAVRFPWKRRCLRRCCWPGR